MNARPQLNATDPYTIKNTPLSAREREQLLDREGSFIVSNDVGEVILVPDRGQQRVYWGFHSIEEMRQHFPAMWAELREHLDREGADYVAMDLAGLPTRTWLDPLLNDADFAFFAEWMDMAHPDITSAEPPEFPSELTMRRAGDEDLERIYGIWQEAYGDYGDGPASFDWLTDEAEWLGALERDGEVVAFAMTGAIDRGAGEILAAAVAPEAWGNGYGTLIVSAAVYALAAQGARRAQIRVRPDIKQALRTCSELGFRHAGAGLEFRRELDEAAITARREARRVAGVKARFGGWR